MFAKPPTENPQLKQLKMVALKQQICLAYSDSMLETQYKNLRGLSGLYKEHEETEHVKIFKDLEHAKTQAHRTYQNSIRKAQTGANSEKELA